MCWIHLRPGRLAFIISGLFEACCSDSGGNREACIVDYEGHLVDQYFLLSGAQVWHAPQEHSTKEAWSRKAQFLSMDEEASIDEILERSYHFADSQHFACTVNAGRYWRAAMNVHVSQMVAWLNLQNESSRFARSEIWGQLGGGGVPFEEMVVFRGGVCSPASCDQELVEVEVLPRYLGHFLLPQLGGTVSFPLVGPGQFQALELASWSSLSLQFAIVGTARCGTTSLQRNLDQHPDIVFTQPEAEDDFFVAHDGSYLPSKIAVDDFNKRFVASDSGRSIILGFYNSLILDSPLQRMVLARIPNLTVILVVCDPIGQFEKTYYAKCCGEENISCTCSMTPVLDDPETLSNALAGHKLHEMRSLFGSRLIVIHQSALRVMPRQVYNALALNLGVQPFDPSMDFYQWNAHKGHRTDLCRNASLLQALQQHFEADYVALEGFFVDSGLTVPAELQLRATRCDRAAEFDEGSLSCINKTRCVRA